MVTVPATSWLGVFTHRHGVDVDFYLSEDDAWHGLACAALDNLDDLTAVTEEAHAFLLTAIVAAYRLADYKLVVGIYNANSGDNNMEVRTVDVANAIKPLERITDAALDVLLSGEEHHPYYDDASKALQEGAYAYRGATIIPAPGDGYTLTGHDRYDTLDEALDAVDDELGCMLDEDDDHPNQCTKCEQWFTDDNYIRYNDQCVGCSESLD